MATMNRDKVLVKKNGTIQDLSGDPFTFRSCILGTDSKGNIIYSDAKIGESDYMNLNNGIWIKIREDVKRRDKNVCVHCGAAYPLTVHHSKYPQIWGEENLNDLETLCEECHNKVHGRTKGE